MSCIVSDDTVDEEVSPVTVR